MIITNTTTTTNRYTLRDDWATLDPVNGYGYSLTDDGTQVTFYIKSSGLPGIQQSPVFVLYAKGVAYAAAQALNSGAGYSNPDLISAIGAFLSGLATT